MLIKTSTDPEFVNTATDSQPMEIPEKYYTCVESKLGFGRVHAVVYADGNVEAYFGTPEKTLDYYWNFEAWAPSRPELPPISNVVFNEWDIPPLMVLVGCSIIALTVGPPVYYRATKKKVDTKAEWLILPPDLG